MPHSPLKRPERFPSPEKDSLPYQRPFLITRQELETQKLALKPVEARAPSEAPPTPPERPSLAKKMAGSERDLTEVMKTAMGSRRDHFREGFPKEHDLPPPS